MECIAIGTIHSPFRQREGMPIQPAGAEGAEGTVEVFPEFQAGLRDLEGFSHAILLYHFHRSEGYDLEVVPFMDTTPRGLFATRAPRRPNPIGMSIVRVLQVAKGTLHIHNVDILDGTPLLDIKPYVPRFDCPGDVRSGWLDKTRDDVATKRSDDRFK